MEKRKFEAFGKFVTSYEKWGEWPEFEFKFDFERLGELIEQ